jgi:hypothetical protein
MTTSTLHSSLRARTNRVLACVWLVALGGVLFYLRRVPWTMVLLGVASGALQGVLQRRALREGATALLSARAALEIRAAMMATRPGRAQINVLWGSFAVYVVALFLQRAERSMLGLAPLLFSAIFAQWFVREAMTVGACAELERAGGAR